jgi:hypothetical protein
MTLANNLAGDTPQRAATVQYIAKVIKSEMKVLVLSRVTMIHTFIQKHASFDVSDEACSRDN